MKAKLFFLLALLIANAQAATLVPVQLLNPTGSTSGQAIVSTGGSSAPSWSATLGGITFTGTTQVSDSSPVFALNDTSGTHTASLFFNNVAIGEWALTNTSSTNALTVDRYVAGTLTDHPVSIANGTGIVTMTDGLTGTPISGSTGSFTTLAASSTVSGTGFSTYLASPPAIGGTAAAAGSFTTLSSTGNFTPSQTNGIVGTTTNNSANAGSVGEKICAQVSNGGSPTGCATNSSTPVSLTSVTPANVTSISLTAGDWDVCGQVSFFPAATTITSQLIAAISTTSAALPNPGIVGGSENFLTLSFTSNANQVLPLTCTQELLSATTTVYLVADAAFTTSTMTSGGWIMARRRR